MFILEDSKSKKRRRGSRESMGNEQKPAAKKQKPTREYPRRGPHRPASFWDSLSKGRSTDLAQWIIPSKTDTTPPALPNFFVEGKSSQGRADVAKRQAMYDGAVGACAIHKLQNYGVDEPVYDNKAYSHPWIYQTGKGTLTAYTVHHTRPTVLGGDAEHYTTQTRSFAITDTSDRFREGATAYRNDRDLAMTDRDSFVEQANERARQMPISSSNTTIFSDNRTSLSPLFANSDTSEDELARDGARPKRFRPARIEYQNNHEQTIRRSPALPHPRLHSAWL